MKHDYQKTELRMVIRRIKWSTFGSVIDKSSLLILTPLLAYRLLPAQLGLIAIMTLVGFYVNTISDMGLCNVAGREIAKNKNFLLARYTVTFRTCILLTLLPLGLIFLHYTQAQGKNFIFIYLMLLASIGTSYNLSWFYLSIDKSHWVVVVNLSKSLFILSGVLFLVKDSNDLNRLALIFVLAHSIYALVNLYCLRRFSGAIFCSGKEFKNLFSITFKSALINCLLLFLILIYNSVDTFLLSSIKGLTSVGFYNVGAKLPKTAQEAILILGAGIFPSLARWSVNKQNLSLLVTKMINIFSLLTLPFILLTGLYSEQLTTLLFSPSFHRSWFILYFMLPFASLFFINNIFRMIAIASSNEHYAMAVTLLGLIINILGNVILIPLYNETGCVGALFISEILMVSIYTIIFRRSLSMSISILKPVSLVLGSYAILILSMQIFHLSSLLILGGILIFSSILIGIYYEWFIKIISNYFFPKKEITTYV